MARQKESVTRIKQLLASQFGINRQLDGNADASLSAVCDNGAFLGKERDGILVFRGIPYALPPTGERRWRRPVPFPPREGTFEAFYNGKTPIQTEWETVNRPGKKRSDRDAR